MSANLIILSVITLLLVVALVLQIRANDRLSKQQSWTYTFESAVDDVSAVSIVVGSNQVKELKILYTTGEVDLVEVET